VKTKTSGAHALTFGVSLAKQLTVSLVVKGSLWLGPQAQDRT